MPLTFVTGNQGKFQEAQHALGPKMPLVQDTNGYDEIQADTLEAVARRGLEDLSSRLEPPYFLEDAGLFIDELQGFPGVFSAHTYKTLGCDGVLKLLWGTPDGKRPAQFQAVIAYRDADGDDHIFEGICKGQIVEEARGDNGFGFDPIFQPMGHKNTFAEMDAKEKNQCSHRGKTLTKFKKHLKANPPPTEATAAAKDESIDVT